MPQKSEFNTHKFQKWLYVCGITLIIAWISIYFPLLFSSSYMPDEGWFLNHALDSAIQTSLSNGSWASTLFLHPNDFGYGGFWWGFYVLLVKISSLISPPSEIILTHASDVMSFRMNIWDIAPDGTDFLQLCLWLMRAAAVSLLLIFLLRLLRRGLSEPLAFLAAALLLTTPMMYWSGKVASAEFFGALLIIIAALQYFERSNTSWFFMVGLGTGIKLSCAPVALALFFFALPGEWKKSRWYGIFILLMKFGVGFLLSNLYAIVHPAESVETLLALSRQFPAAPWHPGFLIDPQPFWEGGTYGSLAYWFGSLWAFVAILVLSIFTNWRLGIWLLLSALLMLGFMLTQPIHNWYWFPVILGSVLPLAFARIPQGWYRQMIIIGAIAILAGNLQVSAQEIGKELAYRRVQISEHQNYFETERCLQLIVRDWRPVVIYDMASLGKLLSLPPEQKRMRYDESWAQLPDADRIGEANNRLAILGPKALLASPIADFVDKNLRAGADHGRCGSTVWIRF